MVASAPRAALITGGTRGIGRAVGRRLASDGFSTIILNYAQDDDAAEEARRLVEQSGATCHLVRANLGNIAAIDDLCARTQELCEHLDAFVHCAALGSFKPLSEVRPNQWDLSFAINTRAFLYCMQKCRQMMSGGAAVAISSLGGRLALPNYGAIGPSKAALEAVVRQLAAELGPDGIRVNAVAAGVIDGPTMASFPGFDTMKERIIRQTPSGRLGTAADVADVVAFLISPEARWIQGQVIVADGGFSLGINPG